MAITIDWGTKVINVPKSDLGLVQSTPTEIRELDLNWFRLQLKDLEDSVDGIPMLDTHVHNPPVNVGGVELARVVEIINGYTVTFEDGQYAVNLFGANGNLADRTNVNQVSVRSANSAGLVNSADIEYGSFDGAVHIDVINGVSGTIYPTGTPRQPVNNVQDAVLIAERRGFDTIFVIGDIALTTGDDLSDFIVVGQDQIHTNITIEDGANVLNSLFRDCTITGILDGDNIIENSRISNIQYLNGQIKSCLIRPGTITLDGGNDAHFLDCWTEINGSVPVIDMGGTGQSLNLAGYRGSIRLTNLSDPNERAELTIVGNVELDSTMADGSVVLIGTGNYTDNSGAGCTVDDTGFVSQSTISKAVWDESVELHNIDGSTADIISHINKNIGNIWYVDGINGDDNNLGKNPHYTFRTIGKAFSVLGDSDAVRIARGSYLEDGLDLANNGVTINAEIGATIVSSVGPVLTISGQNNQVYNLGVTSPVTPQIGFNMTGDRNVMELCTASLCSVGYRYDSLGNGSIKCRAFGSTVTGFDIRGQYMQIFQCTSAGQMAGSRGFYLSSPAAMFCILTTCVSQANPVAGFEVVAGSSFNSFSDCYTGAGDGARVDDGSNNLWEGGSFAVGGLTPDVIAGSVWNANMPSYVSSDSFGAAIQRLLGLSHENAFIDNTDYDSDSQLLSARVRIFDSAANCDAATDGGDETTGLITSYNISTTYGDVGEFSAFKQVLV